MTIVKPPCILDFGKAYVDVPPVYSAEALTEAEEAERELFTEDQWKQVRLVRAALLRYGIHYFDARPSNVMFPWRVSGAEVRGDWSLQLGKSIERLLQMMILQGG